MTRDEENTEKLRLIERYAQLQSQIERLRLRLHGYRGYLDQLDGQIESAEDLADVMPMMDNVVKAIGDVRLDIDELSKAVHERRQLEGALRRMNLSALIQRP